MGQSTGTTPDITIIFEDDHLLVVQKPVNVLSQKDHTGDPDLLTLCKTYLQNNLEKPGSIFLGLVHRLDRPVGGLMVLAKSSKAAAGLSDQIRTRNMQKQYNAVVHGELPPNGMLVNYLIKDQKNNRVTVTDENNKNAKRAELTYIRLQYHAKKDLSLVKINLLTGRPHQIRVQFSEAAHPLYGDGKYGKISESDQPIALYATRLKFTHPISGNKLSLSAKPGKSYPWNLFDRL